jgi:hypothetical protein
MTHYLNTRGFGVDLAPDEASELIRRLHLRKTDVFIELIESGALPLRPGVRRIMEEAAALDLTLGICTTANERAARAIANGLLAGIPLAFVLAGDVVRAKKPDPAIYRLALEKSGLKPKNAWCSRTPISGSSPPRLPACMSSRRRTRIRKRGSEHGRPGASIAWAKRKVRIRNCAPARGRSR